MRKYRVHFFCGWGVEIIAQEVRALNPDAAAKDAGERLVKIFPQFAGFRWEHVAAVPVGI